MSRALLAALALTMALAGVASAQPAPDAYRVYADGEPATLHAVVRAAAVADVLVLGEEHDGALGHALRAELLDRLQATYGAERPLVLALEMFERDVQLVLDEYAQGLVREQDFLAASRPWGTYAQAYRPLVELARAHGWAIVAANVPGRYASLVAREGTEALGRLSAEAQVRYLPALPVAPPSEALADAFHQTMAAMMEAHGGHGMDVERLLAAQNLRDAAMAEALHLERLQRPGALIVHVNGAFHSEGGLGVPEHLARLAPEARVVTVTMRRHADFPALAADAFRPGDAFVIVLDPAADAPAAD